MSLDLLIEQIRTRAQAELDDIARHRASEEARIRADTDRALAQLTADSAHETDLEIARERAQRVAAAKLEARKEVYEAREQRLRSALDATRGLLAEYTASDAYAATLKRMVDVSTDELGKSVKISGRAEDASRLSRVAGKSFDPTPRPIIGGLIAESSDGRRQLNLSLDELLRLREDRVRELLS